MRDATGQDGAAAPGPRPQLFAELARKALLLAETDSGALAHCRVPIGVLTELARQVVVVARASDHMSDIEALGVGVIDFDCRTSWGNPALEALAAWKLARIFEAERPDVVHCVGLRPVALGCLALKLAPVAHVVVHLPELGPLETASGGSGGPYRALALRLVASLLRKPTTFLLVESADDLAELRAQGVEPGPRFTVLGGVGIDPDVYPVLPPPHGDMPVAAFVGPLTEASGVEVLMRAFDRLWARGVRLQLELLGEPAPQGARDIAPQALARWASHPGVRCAGRPADVREVWRRAEIAVLPARSRQGLPRALLEAAACGRALIVIDAAGGRGFVRDGVEGFVVPPQDAPALAEALERLARDPELRARMGEAARLRVLQGFTEAHVRQALRSAYVSVLGGNRPSQRPLAG